MRCSAKPRMSSLKTNCQFKPLQASKVPKSSVSTTTKFLLLIPSGALQASLATSLLRNASPIRRQRARLGFQQPSIALTMTGKITTPTSAANLVNILSRPSLRKSLRSKNLEPVLTTTLPMTIRKNSVLVTTNSKYKNPF